jgi:outer membrane protein, heavy metal efflux system
LKLRHLPVIVTFIVALIACPMRAQQAARRLTITDALDMAEKRNLDLRSARAKQAVALAGVRTAGERPNPTASLGVSRDSPHENALIDQPIEIGPKRERRIHVARQEVIAAEVDIAAVEKEVRRRVRDAYFSLAHARGSTAQQAAALRLAERLHEIAQVRFEAGDVAQLEVTQAELEVARAKANLEVAQQEENVALSGLNAALDEPADTNWDLGDALATPPATPVLQDLLVRAANSNAEVARISQEMKTEQSRKALLEAERVPNLGLQFGTDLNAPGAPGQKNTGGYIVGPRGQLSMELPIFSRNQGEIAQSIANERALEADLEAARRAVDSEVESAYFELQARQTQAQLYRETILPSSHRLEEMAEESYRAGKAELLTVLGAQRDVQQVERDYLDSLFVLQAAFAQLEEAVGSPLD